MANVRLKQWIWSRDTVLDFKFFRFSWSFSACYPLFPFIMHENIRLFSPEDVDSMFPETVVCMSSPRGVCTLNAARTSNLTKYFRKLKFLLS